MLSEENIPLSVELLIEAIQNGFSPKYLFFWLHQSQKEKSCLSQCFEAPFRRDNTTYLTAEHFMMAEKARLFHDKEIENKIINAIHPGEAKALGKMIRKFDQTQWDEHRFEIVVQGNLLKFAQNPHLK